MSSLVRGVVRDQRQKLLVCGPHFENLFQSFVECVGGSVTGSRKPPWITSLPESLQLLGSCSHILEGGMAVWHGNAGIGMLVS